MMTLTPRHRVHFVSVALLERLHRVQRLGDPWPDSAGG